MGLLLEALLEAASGERRMALKRRGVGDHADARASIAQRDDPITSGRSTGSCA